MSKFVIFCWCELFSTSTSRGRGIRVDFWAHFTVNGITCECFYEIHQVVWSMVQLFDVRCGCLMYGATPRQYLTTERNHCIGGWAEEECGCAVYIYLVKLLRDVACDVLCDSYLHAQSRRYTIVIVIGVLWISLVHKIGHQMLHNCECLAVALGICICLAGVNGDARIIPLHSHSS